MISQKIRLAKKIARKFIGSAQHSKAVFIEAVVDDPSELLHHIQHALPSLDISNWETIAHHMTIKFLGGVPVSEIKEYYGLLGVKVPLNIVGLAVDNKAVALVVDPPSYVPVKSMSKPHITIAVSAGTKPVYSNHLIEKQKKLIPMGGVVHTTIGYSDENKIDHFDAPSLRMASKREDELGLLPIFNPLFNLREACKQILLLEDHLNNVRKRCPDCICKHFMTIEALVEEAISLDVQGEYWHVLDGLAQRVRDLQSSWFRASESPNGNSLILLIAQGLRMMRKDIAPLCVQVGADTGVKIATKSVAEKEEEQAQSLIKQESKLKPNRKDLKKTRLDVEDKDIQPKGVEGDKDLSLNYKQVGG